MNITANLTVTANFALITYTIATTAGAGRSITRSGNIAVGYGHNQTFNILPADGYYIIQLLVDGTAIEATQSNTFLSVTSNHSIHVDFTPITGHSTLSEQHMSLPSYPNPAKHVLTITTENLGELDSECFYEIVDQMGRVLLSGKMKNMAFSIDVGMLAQRGYHLRIWNQNTRKTAKFIIAR